MMKPEVQGVTLPYRIYVRVAAVKQQLKAALEQGSVVIK